MRPAWLPTSADLPGVALTFVIGLVSVGIVSVLPRSPFVSDVLIAMFLGVIVVNSPIAKAIGIHAQGDRWAAGLRYTGRWLLRVAIVLMGMKVQTSFFGRTELVLMLGVAVASIPSAFFVAHVLGRLLGVRVPMTDLLAGGTMICGASAVNAIAPAVGARREEQGVAIGVVFLFSVVAMLSFRATAVAVGLDASYAGLWSGLAVNDLSSAVAVGTQMGGAGGVMAAASKSARILFLAPVLVTMSVLRRDADAKEDRSLVKSIREGLPGFLVGYVALAVVRAVGDRVFGDAASWKTVLTANRFVLDVLMSAVSAGIGLHLSLKTILGSSARAVGVGGGASIWMAGLTLALIVCAARDQAVAAVVVGAAGLVVSYVAYRLVPQRLVP